MSALAETRRAGGKALAPPSPEPRRYIEAEWRGDEPILEGIEGLWGAAGAAGRSLGAGVQATPEQPVEEQIRSERERGIVCGECSRSPTEIRMQENEEFGAHLERVRGVAVESGR